MIKKTPIVCIAGKSESGKTTLIEKLIPELKKCGIKNLVQDTILYRSRFQHVRICIFSGQRCFWILQQQGERLFLILGCNGKYVQVQCLLHRPDGNVTILRWWELYMSLFLIQNLSNLPRQLLHIKWLLDKTITPTLQYLGRLAVDAVST